MLLAPSPPEPTSTVDPRREVCPDCREPVIVAIVAGVAIRAEPHEWEPRARCYVCSGIAARGQKRANCDRCGGIGYVGSNRPTERALAIDVAWSDDGHVRILGPRTPRRKGEALYALHECRGAVVALAA